MTLLRGYTFRVSGQDDFEGPGWLKAVDPRYRRLVGGTTFIALYCCCGLQE